MSRAGTPLDNAPIESFSDILKTEFIYRQKIQTIQQAQALFNDYTHFYNHERLQLKYDLTPFEKRHLPKRWLLCCPFYGRQFTFLCGRFFIL